MFNFLSFIQPSGLIVCEIGLAKNKTGKDILFQKKILYITSTSTLSYRRVYPLNCKWQILFDFETQTIPPSYIRISTIMELKFTFSSVLTRTNPRHEDFFSFFFSVHIFFLHFLYYLSVRVFFGLQRKRLHTWIRLWNPLLNTKGLSGSSVLTEHLNCRRSEKKNGIKKNEHQPNFRSK